MKKLNLFLIVSVIFFFSSCSKDGISSSAYFNAKLDGKNYKCSGAYAYATTFSDTYNIYGVADENTTGRAIYIAIDKSKAEGTYSLTGGKEFALFQDENKVGYRSDYKGGSGEVTITKKTATNVKGTFKCVVQQNPNGSGKSVSFTEGEFSVEFR
jgi:hypothetical protein